ncbi:hypothetical protein SEA_WEASELS2_263 [Rhodococcus phage Weasels2]|uniref:Uncharacterized protein n=1 Tax=Rhodococcus phage Weasels2 TaxID=1897437 RepID=A0A1I9SAN5_9CAUD|nr:hypothetical protein FDH04_gp153 [Rhodococcus phage Weasels2]AOZ63841.1 hypothetical protein SEA_WEASELS2_263 [Rhodococcus phage Weasels2]
MFKLMRYDRIPTVRSQLQASFTFQPEAIAALASRAITFAQHGRHIEFVKGGFDIINEYDKVSVAFRIIHED